MMMMMLAKKGTPLSWLILDILGTKGPMTRKAMKDAIQEIEPGRINSGAHLGKVLRYMNETNKIHWKKPLPEHADQDNFRMFPTWANVSRRYRNHVRQGKEGTADQAPPASE